MTKQFLILLVSVCWADDATAQYKYGIQPLGYDEYLETVKKDARKQLVNITEYVPGVVLDIRYATTNNFTGERIYDLALAYARKPVAEALRAVQLELKKRGLGLKIFDGYRPYRATVKFYEVYKDTTYVASPYRGSRHNRGCAIDLTLIYLESGKELRMPTGYDAFTKQAWPSTPVKDPVARENRSILISVMEKNGFRVNSSEWWHFDFRGWKSFEILDIEFNDLHSK